MLTLEKGMVFEQLLVDLENEGYTCQTFIIPACAVNAPHRRDRVWVVAYSGCRYGERAEIRGEIKGSISEEENASLSERSTRNDRKGITANASSKGLQGNEQPGTPEEEERASLSITQCHWNESWLEVAPRLCGMDARVPSRVDRFRALGNAIVPQVAASIMECIKSIDDAYSSPPSNTIS